MNSNELLEGQHAWQLDALDNSVPMVESQLRLLTLNCWGLKFISKFRKERYEAIVNEILESNYDIVNLQEVWVFAEFQYIKDRLSKQFPHSKFFYSGALGAGLVIFSRFPFIRTSIFPYSLNGEPIDVGAGDWFVGKAAASITIIHPLLGQVEIFNTHLFAKGGDHVHRLINAWEFAKLARQSAELGRYVIAAGDFNSIPSALPIVIINEHTGCTDSWSVTHLDSQSDEPPSTSTQAISQFGVTADSPLNTWSAGKSIGEDTRRYGGKRLDYVFYRQPRRFHDPLQKYSVLRAADCKVVLTEKVPGKGYSYSDHFGLEATFEIQQILGNELSNDQSELSNEIITDTIQQLTTFYRTTKARSSRELAIFGSSLLACIVLAVGSAWLPYFWISPIFVVAAVAFAWLATTMLYEGFLYGNWERNVLMNMIEELEIYRVGLSVLSGHPPSP